MRSVQDLPNGRGGVPYYSLLMQAEKTIQVMFVSKPLWRRVKGVSSMPTTGKPGQNLGWSHYLLDPTYTDWTMRSKLPIDDSLQRTRNNEEKKASCRPDTCCLPTTSIAGVAGHPDAGRAALPKVEPDA